MFCVKCGTQLRDDVAFCVKCGAMLHPAVASEPTTPHMPPPGSVREGNDIPAMSRSRLRRQKMQWIALAIAAAIIMAVEAVLVNIFSIAGIIVSVIALLLVGFLSKKAIKESGVTILAIVHLVGCLAVVCVPIIEPRFSWYFNIVQTVSMMLNVLLILIALPDWRAKGAKQQTSTPRQKPAGRFTKLGAVNIAAVICILAVAVLGSVSNSGNAQVSGSNNNNDTQKIQNWSIDYCEGCNGYGYSERRKCGRCGGDGVLSVPLRNHQNPSPADFRCPDCVTGNIDTQCDLCGGKGYSAGWIRMPNLVSSIFDYVPTLIDTDLIKKLNIAIELEIVNIESGDPRGGTVIETIPQSGEIVNNDGTMVIKLAMTPNTQTPTGGFYLDIMDGVYSGNKNPVARTSASGDWYIEPCLECSGKGGERSECSSCKGSGKLTWVVAGGFLTGDCVSCGGIGEAVNACRACGGIGCASGWYKVPDLAGMQLADAVNAFDRDVIESLFIYVELEVFEVEAGSETDGIIFETMPAAGETVQAGGMIFIRFATSDAANALNSIW